MKKRRWIKVLIVILIVILSFIIPVRKEEKEVWYVNNLTSYGRSKNFYYNIYGMKIWPYLSKYEQVRK